VTAAGDAWAVGWNKTGGGIQPVAMQWDGSDWHLRNPDPPSEGASYEAVTVIGVDDVWAFGFRGPQTGFQAFVTHWDGNQWQELAAPKFDDGAGLWDAAATSPTDVVAVGAYWEGPFIRTLGLHWDGLTWKQDSMPQIPVTGAIYPPLSNQYLRCVTSANGAYWAGGLLIDGSYNHLRSRRTPLNAARRTSSHLNRRCPPRVRNDGSIPASAHRPTMCVDTPKTSATCRVVSMSPSSYSGSLASTGTAFSSPFRLELGSRIRFGRSRLRCRCRRDALTKGATNLG
jgi:hypothetical protein